jgi:hypothetical protein
MKVEAVTTFSRQIWDFYGREFVLGWIKHAPDVPLACYHESQPDPSLPVAWRNLDDDPDRKAFIAKHSRDAEKVGLPSDYRSQSIRFCHKVFAVTDAARKSTADWLVWIDCDVQMKGKPDLARVLPEGKDLAFLWRSWSHSECGFVGYRLTEPKVRLMLEDMRLCYTSGEIFALPKSKWHDSAIFDVCRLRSGVPHARWNSLSSTPHLRDVWDSSPLADWADHNKGPRRKEDAYGAASLRALG